MSTRLTRGRVGAAAVAVVTVAAVAVLTSVVAPRWWRGEGGAYAPRRALVRTQVTPGRSLFGEVLSARADVVVDPGRIDPASVDLAVDFRPFRIRTESRRVADGPGRATVVRFRYEIQCVTQPCVPRGAKGTPGAATAIRLKPSRLTAHGRDGRPFAERVAWPVVGVQSRLTEDEIALSTPSIDHGFAPPAVSWRISPDLLGGLALSAAALLVLGAGWLVASAVRTDGRPLRTWRIPAHLTPVERALVLAEHAVANGEIAESRKALERLAAELRRRGADAYAGDAERLAWSGGTPSPTAVATLATAVRSNGAG